LGGDFLGVEGGLLKHHGPCGCEGTCTILKHVEVLSDEIGAHLHCPLVCLKIDLLSLNIAVNGTFDDSSCRIAHARIYTLCYCPKSHADGTENACTASPAGPEVIGIDLPVAKTIHLLPNLCHVRLRHRPTLLLHSLVF
jgi:hypothetical protein